MRRRIARFSPCFHPAFTRPSPCPRPQIPPALVENTSKLRLFRQERNPPDVARLARSDVDPSVTAPAGPSPALSLRSFADGKLAEAVESEVGRLLAESARPDEIAIISLAGQTRSELARLDRVGEHLVARADAADAAQHLISDTFLRFKGLERPFVIVVELGRARGERYETRMHIALTRATTGCTIVADEAELEAEPRFAGLRSN